MESLRNATTAAQFEDSLPVPGDDDPSHVERGSGDGNEYPYVDNGIDDEDDAGYEDLFGASLLISLIFLSLLLFLLLMMLFSVCGGVDLQFLLVVLLSVCFAVMVFIPHESWLTQIGLTSVMAFLAISMLFYGSMRRGDGSLLLMSIKAFINRRKGFEELDG
eukprot:TRINITY_DN2028_c0_g1_i1.p1 TRINITY_DN2028_c0_g1~~TRINITY_DN2028_c0_g1_i1.p1  ORF type:complete len:162 (-),score=38.59 TRINITY_DN2028_c0_g1_i1:71-556(-)